MSPLILDYNDSDYVVRLSDNMAVDNDGHTMLKTGNNTAIDMETGEMHIVSPWHDNDEDL